MKKFFAPLAVLALVYFASGCIQPAKAADKVYVCDPDNPANCAKPDSSGNIPVTGGGSSGGASIGVNGATAPASSNQVGSKDASGNLQPASAATPLTVVNVPVSYTLLSNASATGAAVLPYGGNYLLGLSGTFGGTTVSLTSTVNGSTSTLATYTSAPTTAPCFLVTTGTSIQAVITGGAPSAMYATLGGGGSGGCAGSVVSGNVGGYEFNTAAIPTVQNAAYAAGQSLGGLQTISIGSTSGISGILDQVSIASTGGSTVATVMYVWDKNPSGTTCTDKTNFVKSQTDNQHLITGIPILLTPALVVSAQDVTTYAAAANLTNNFVNSSANTNLYVCLLANASVTPATTTDYRINIQGVKDQQ